MTTPVPHEAVEAELKSLDEAERLQACKDYIAKARRMRKAEKDYFDGVGPEPSFMGIVSYFVLIDYHMDVYLDVARELGADDVVADMESYLADQEAEAKKQEEEEESQFQAWLTTFRASSSAQKAELLHNSNWFNKLAYETDDAEWESIDWVLWNKLRKETYGTH